MNDGAAQRDRGSRNRTTGTGHAWELEHWRPGAVVRRAGEWVRASRRRHRLVVALGIVLAFIILPGCLGAVATAQSGSSGSQVSSTTSSALSWMNVRDSSGVNLTNYSFVTDSGGIFHLDKSGLALVINMEFAGWMVIVITGIWLTGYALSFQWMDLLAAPLRAVARGFTEQVNLPIVFLTAATIGAFCVAWFWLRGFHTKAVLQIITMLLVAVLSPLFLADPLADVLSSNGWLSQGRDLGITIASGLNGDGKTRPTAVVASLQEQLADNFARKPLQAWNFGHVIDDQLNCKVGWSSAVNSGDDDRVRNALRSCGDGVAYAATKKPTAGQVGIGLLVLVAGAMLLAFGAALSIRIIRAALDAVYYSFLAIFGFAAGGFVYGPTQTFLVRSTVHAFFAAARMAVTVIFLGVYLLFLGDVFKHAQGQVLAVFILGAILEYVALKQLKRLDGNLERGNDWIANRLALAVHGPPVKSSGGTALGMGTVGAQRNGFSVLKAVGATSLIAGSPITAALLRRPDGTLPGNPIVRMLENLGLSPGGGSRAWATQGAMNRPMYRNAALAAAQATGGVDTVRGAAAAVHAVSRLTANNGDIRGALFGAGFEDDHLVERAIASHGAAGQSRDDHLARAVNLMPLIQATAGQIAQHGETPELAAELAAHMATMEQSVLAYRGHEREPIVLDGGQFQGPQWGFVDAYMHDPVGALPRLTALGKLANGEEMSDNATTHPFEAELLDLNVTPLDAANMWDWLGRELGQNAVTSFEAMRQDPQNAALRRQANRSLAQAQAAVKQTAVNRATPWTQLNPQP